MSLIITIVLLIFTSDNTLVFGVRGWGSNLRPVKSNTAELQTGRLVQARTRKFKPEPGPNPKTNLKSKSCPKKTIVQLGLKNLAMLSIYFNYIFVHLKQKARLRPELSPKFLSTLDPKPARTRTRPKKPALTYNSETQCCQQLANAATFLLTEVCCLPGEWRGDGPDKLVTRFNVIQQVLWKKDNCTLYWHHFYNNYWNVICIMFTKTYFLQMNILIAENFALCISILIFDKLRFYKVFG